MSNLHILITGGAGFVGTHIIRSLAELHPQYTLSVFDIVPYERWKDAKPYITYVQGDIRSPSDCLRAVELTQPTAIIHAAGIVPTGNERYFASQRTRDAVFAINVDGTRNMLAAAQSLRPVVKAFVFTASITMVTDDNGTDYPNFNETVAMNPTLVYGQSKVAAEPMVLAANDPDHDFVTCSIRPAATCGEGDYHLVKTIHKCIAKFETPFAISTPDGSTGLYDFTYVGNVADAHVLAVHNLLTAKTAAGEAFFITNGSPVPFRAFCLATWAHFGHVPPFVVNLPKRVASWAGWVAEWATWMSGKEVTFSRGSVRDYCQTAYADIGKARRVLGYEPRVSLAEGLRRSCDDLKERMRREEEEEKPKDKEA